VTAVRTEPATVTRVLRIAGMAFRAITTPGDSAGPTFVLVHGIGVSHRYLARLHERLSASGTVHSIDLPGFGGLPKPDRAPSVAEMAGAIGDVVAGLGVTDAVLVGHSMGCQWVVELAAQRPGLARLAVIMGPVADSAHRTALAQSLALAVDTLGEPPAANVAVFVDYLRCGPRWYSQQLPFMLGYRIEDRVGDLTVPVLVLRGGKDPIAGLEWCRRLRENARSGALVIIPGSHHVAQMSAPRAVASAILAHVPVADSGSRERLSSASMPHGRTVPWRDGAD
jgi:pimeloyl-ACP methyl ester carboxylesterase